MNSFRRIVLLGWGIAVIILAASLCVGQALRASLPLRAQAPFNVKQYQEALLFRAASRLSGWLGLTDTAGYWSLKALSVSLPSRINENDVATMSQRYGVPLSLVRKVIWIESRGRHIGPDNNILTSSKGALGVMQLMPNTAKELSIDPLDVRDNIRGGLMYLSQLSHKYQGDWDKVIAAYNWGQGNLDIALMRYGDHWQHALPRESAVYLSQARG